MADNTRKTPRWPNRQTGTCAPAQTVLGDLAFASRNTIRPDVLFWLNLFAAAIALASGGLWLVAPRLYSRKLPSDESEVWSLPRLNGTALIARLIRWTLRKRIRQMAWGAYEIAFGVFFLWLAFHSGGT
jgi:hypothetical protein